MCLRSLALASTLVVMLAGTTAWAQSGTSEKTPGHIMQRTPQSKSTGPGASEYAPGHLKRKSGSESERWSCFLRQAVKVDSAMKRVIHHEDAETVFG
jgi:hypothetical protein